jgi:all-beta uncharacterized protein/BACON domain-containing protein
VATAAVSAMRNRRAGRQSLAFLTIPSLLACFVSAGACGSSSNTVTAPAAISKCAVTVDVPNTTIPASGGSGTVNVQTERECQWTAQPDVAWLSITTGSSGQGPGTIQFMVASNGDPASRTGDVMVNGQKAQVAQAAGECRFDLSSAATALGQSGGTATVDVRASSALCAWTATSDVNWISITSSSTGKGSSTVSFSVQPTTGPPRAGTLTIAGLHFSVTQSEGCTYSIAPTTYSPGAAGGSQSIAVTAAAGCPWTAMSNVNWITVSAASGTGSGSVIIAVAPTSGPTRSGTVAIAGQTVTVNQGQGCTVSLSSASASVPVGGGDGSFDVRTGDGCGWAATSSASWLTITAGATGTGDGTVRFTAAASTGPQRTGTISAGGQTFTVMQGGGCTFSISPQSQNLSNSGGSTTVAVTAPAGCAWTASSNAPWLSIASGATGSGNGTVQLTVAANSDTDRSGTATIAGQTFTVNQSNGCTFTLSPSSQTMPAAGGSASFAVNTNPSCAWTTTSNAGWLSVTAGLSGSGPGTVRFSATANTGAARTGTITAGGQTFTVTEESGCTATVTPDTITEDKAGGAHNVNITTTADCTWTAVSNVTWITIGSPTSGSGNATVHLDVQANTGPARTGTATVAGDTVTVNQTTGCTISIAPKSQSIGIAGGTGMVTVTAGAGCTWTAVSQASWIHVTAGSSGSGNGAVTFSVDSNSGKMRNDSINIGGQMFTVNQAGS